jgi:hypothetical protein
MCFDVEANASDAGRGYSAGMERSLGLGPDVRCRRSGTKHQRISDVPWNSSQRCNRPSLSLGRVIWC